MSVTIYYLVIHYIVIYIKSRYYLSDGATIKWWHGRGSFVYVFPRHPSLSSVYLFYIVPLSFHLFIN